MPRFDTKRKEEFLKLLSKGIRRSHAATKVGITRHTYLAHMDKYPAFAEAMLEAELEANELVEQALYKTALGGNVTAQQVWLYNRDPARWSDKRNVQMTGPNGGPIQSDIRYTGVSVEELDRRIQEQYSMLGFDASETPKTSLDEARKALSSGNQGNLDRRLEETPEDTNILSTHTNVCD